MPAPCTPALAAEPRATSDATPRAARPDRARRGYSLIECLIAAGLMTGVVLSISGLFIAGSRSVRSGRELTKATALANSAMEQVLGWPYERVYGFAGAPATAETQSWSTDDANPTWQGTPEDIADMTAVAADWRTRAQEELPEGTLTYRVDGIGRLPSEGDDGLDSFVDADFIRVTVTVEWSESAHRRRQVTFEEIVL